MPLTILTEPNPILRKKAKKILEVGKEERDIMKDMLHAMYESNGIGLAANQVGILKRIIVIDLQDEDQSHNRSKNFYPLYIANPEIIYQSSEMIDAEEGCLSLPNQCISVKRPKAIKIKYLNFDNEYRELEDSCWLARAIQHEMDHLDGILLIDYLSKMKKDMVLRKLIKANKKRK